MKIKFIQTLLLACVLILSTTSCFKEIYEYNNGGPTIVGNKENTTEVREIPGNFDKIAKAGFMDLIISEGNTDGKIELNGESNLLEYIETRVEGSTLHIHTKKNTSIRAHKKIFLKVNVSNLSELSTAGSGNISTEGKLVSKQFKISQAGSSDLKLDLETEKLYIKMAGSGDIRLAGKTDNLKVSKSGSGDLYAYDFMVKNAEINSTGSGDAELNIENTLDISKTGSGDISYKGKPKVKAKSTGSGDIIEKK